VTIGPHVLIDATAVPVERGGVGRYVEDLIMQVAAPLSVVCQARDLERWRAAAPQATIYAAPHRTDNVIARLVWEQFALPRLARTLGAQVIHSPHYTMPVLTRLARVVTVHDATFFSDPGVHTTVKRTFFRAWTRLSARYANVIVTPSQATDRELRRYVPATAAATVVAVHGVDADRFREPNETESRAIRESTGLGDRPWIAFLGTIEPRKNVPALIEAYSALAEKLSAAGRPVPVLALAGAAGWEQRVESMRAGVHPSATVLMLGYIDQDLLSAFLHDAELVVYPSMGEGFGLPVLEAMSCGGVVLTTRKLSLPEVGGDAVAYCETDAMSISAAMLELLDDDDRRNALRRSAKTRAATFTWSESARLHRIAYAKAVQGD
jgi:glycosyltransferase involved in cell wall biosynthesis